MPRAKRGWQLESPPDATELSRDYRIKFIELRLRLNSQCNYRFLHIECRTYLINPLSLSCLVCSLTFTFRSPSSLDSALSSDMPPSSYPRFGICQCSLGTLKSREYARSLWLSTATRSRKTRKQFLRVYYSNLNLYFYIRLNC